MAQSVITTIAGNGTDGYSGDGGQGTAALVSHPAGAATDAAGNLYFADFANNRIRKIDAVTGIITTVAGSGAIGLAGDGGPATSAKISNPYDVTVDAAGNLYIVDTYNSRIRKVTAGTGIITTVAGSTPGGPYGGDGGPATSAGLVKPDGIAVAASGDIYIADDHVSRIRKVDAATGIITTVAGTGTAGYSGDGGPATSAQISNGFGIALDGAGNLYIPGGNVIRKVDAATGIISTVAGTGTAGYSGDGGPATSAMISTCYEVTVDAAGNLYITDAGNHRVRMVNAATGIITTIAGTGVAGSSGDGGAPASAQLNQPYGVAVSNTGNIFITEFAGTRIRKIMPVPSAVTGIASGWMSTLTVSPSPCTGRFVITADGTAAGNNEHAGIFLINSIGKVVYERSVTVSGTRWSIPVEVPDAVPNGLYQLSIVSGHGHTYKSVAIAR